MEKHPQTGLARRHSTVGKSANEIGAHKAACPDPVPLCTRKRKKELNLLLDRSTSTTNPIDLPLPGTFTMKCELFAATSRFYGFFSCDPMLTECCYSHESGPCGHRHPWPLRR